MAFSVWIAIYAFRNGDPRKVYHGMNYQGQICGVDLPYQPYVYWCAAEGGGLSGWNLIPVTRLDFEHPICLEFCPTSPLTESPCFDPATGATRPVADYATHPVAKRYCLPQAQAMLDKVQDKLGSHPIEKYIPIVITCIRSGWPVLLGAFFLAIILSYLYLLLIDCGAGMLIWSCMFFLVGGPAVSGIYLIYASQNGGMDGMPGSGDDQTDLSIGIGCCVVAGIFLFISCCMSAGLNKAIKSVESAASCMFHVQSMLFEPLISLAARILLWGGMLYCFVWLIGCGTPRKTKIYRTFTYSADEWVYIGFAVMMMLWLNDLCTAMSQYVVAWVTAKWYFTDHTGGLKLIPDCLLCKAYTTGFIYHIGSLALGSFIIACTRPIRLFMVCLVFAGEATDNAVCACLTKACACLYACFERCLMRFCKNAYIEMAISGLGFCDSASKATSIISKEGGAIWALSGATWLFTLAGIAAIPAAGAFITHMIIVNVKTFNSPLSKWYIQDPIVMDVCAGVVCFVIALCFMLLFDTVADTMLLCLGYDQQDQKANGAGGHQEAAKAAPQQSFFASFFSQAPKQPAQGQGAAARRPQYAHDKLASLVSQHK